MKYLSWALRKVEQRRWGVPWLTTHPYLRWNRNVLEFLGLPSDGRKQFPKVNENRFIRYKSLDKLLTFTDAFIPAAERIKRFLGIRRLWLGVMIRWIRSTLLSKAQKRVSLSAEMNNELVDYFRDDILLISDLTDRDLSTWLVRK